VHACGQYDTIQPHTSVILPKVCTIWSAGLPPLYACMCMCLWAVATGPVQACVCVQACAVAIGSGMPYKCICRTCNFLVGSLADQPAPACSGHARLPHSGTCPPSQLLQHQLTKPSQQPERHASCPLAPHQNPTNPTYACLLHHLSAYTACNPRVAKAARSPADPDPLEHPAHLRQQQDCKLLNCGT